jgi:hypothetical protein
MMLVNVVETIWWSSLHTTCLKASAMQTSRSPVLESSCSVEEVKQKTHTNTRQKTVEANVYRSREKMKWEAVKMKITNAKMPIMNT